MRRLQALMLLLTVLTGSVLLAQEQKKESELTKEERAKLEAEAFRLHKQGMELASFAKLHDAEDRLRQALRILRKLYPVASYPDGHADLAGILNNLAKVLRHKGQLEAARALFQEELAMTRRLYPPERFPNGHADLAGVLNNLAKVLQDKGQLEAARVLFQEELAMTRRLYPPERFPDGHPDLGRSLNSMALLLNVEGQLEAAEAYYRQALVIARKHYSPARYPRGHIHLATCLGNLGAVLKEQGQLTKAEPLYREALAMKRRLYPEAKFPRGDPSLNVSLNNLGSLLLAQGHFTAAQTLYREAWEMAQKLYPPAEYPQGHPDLARSMHSLALALQAQGRYAEAEPLFRDALTMYRRVYPPNRYPQGHPAFLPVLNSLALLLKSQERYPVAEQLYREAMAVAEHLFPRERYRQGHPVLAVSMTNLGSLLRDQGQYAAAEPYYRDALAMNRSLYPLGHRDLAGSLSNWGFFLFCQGRFAEAEPIYREAFRMNRDLIVAQGEQRGEGEMLAWLATLPQAQHGYLSLLAQEPVFAARCYATLWANRSLLTRIAEQKRLAIRAARVSPELHAVWEELVSLKQRRAQLLKAPQVRDPETKKARKKMLEEWGQQINDLSAQVRDGLPALQELQRLDNSTPADLQKAMSKEAVFVDLLRYTLYEYDSKKPGKEGEKWSLRYVAFVVTKDQIHHVDLGPAEPLEAAVKQWRENITKKHTAPDLKSPAALRELLWEPLEKHFPPRTTTVYLCPDQQLCFLPWAALPGKKVDSVLLEDYTLAIVPHGPYLLGQLLGTKEKENKKVDLLVLGGVKYDDAPTQPAQTNSDRGQDDPKAAPVQAAKGGWPYLKGTALEAEAIQKLAAKQKFAMQYLTEKEAGSERFKQELPRARIAHLATHGFFADAKFRSVLQMDPKLFVMHGQERVGAGALLPSLLSGLVFAGANRPETPGRGIVTAEELFDLDLTSMELAVLSACETGLGEVGGGEGVFGLQRAFHVVGCQNVIASLWKVNDVATMVLMEEFYRNLWEKKLTKREALRQAQLTVYRNPDLVLQRAQQMGVRGIEDEAVPLPADKPQAARRSPPSWWAAFVLSGLGE